MYFKFNVHLLVASERYDPEADDDPVTKVGFQLWYCYTKVLNNKLVPFFYQPEPNSHGLHSFWWLIQGQFTQYMVMYIQLTKWGLYSETEKKVSKNYLMPLFALTQLRSYAMEKWLKLSDQSFNKDP